jgi:hypothetical protein
MKLSRKEAQKLLQENRRAWHHQWRARNICHQCRTGRLTINPKTGLPFWKCSACRQKHIDYHRARRATPA